MTPRIWIDTDAACGAGSKTDPDDCLAIALLARSANHRVVGLSTVFGNAALDIVDPIARELVDRLDRSGRGLGKVHTGSAVPLAKDQPPASTAAQTALRQALKDGPLTILALGPLTNVATALEGHPALQKNVARIVAVMGRRPGHIFHPSEGEKASSFLGHGPIFRDFNFVKDRTAAEKLMSLRLPVTLIPYDVARRVSISEKDLQRIGGVNTALEWIVSRSRDWLGYWQTDIGKDGFYPFDLVAAGYILAPQRFNCAEVQVWIGPDRDWFFSPNALLVGNTAAKGTKARSYGPAKYCPEADPSLHDWLTATLEGE